MNLMILTMVIGLLGAAFGLAQEPCRAGVRIEGIITDPTNALVPGARMQSADGITTTTDASGRFVLARIAARAATITVSANGFAALTWNVNKQPGEVVHINLKLTMAEVSTDKVVIPTTSSPEPITTAMHLSTTDLHMHRPLGQGSTVLDSASSQPTRSTATSPVIWKQCPPSFTSI